MFYFPRISSLFNMTKCKKSVDDKIFALKKDLEDYIHWSSTLAAECDEPMPKDKYNKLLSMLKENF